MKTKMTLILATVILFAGCSLIKDSAEVTIPAELSTVITVVVAPQKSVDNIAEANALGFSKTQVLSLADDANIEPYLEKIRKVDILSVNVTINGLVAGQTINSISLDVTGVGTVCTQTNITSTNNSFLAVVSSAILDQIGAKFKSDKMITITVYGNVSGPMTFTVTPYFEVEVIAGALD